MYANCAKCCIFLTCVIICAASSDITPNSTLMTVETSSHTTEMTDSSTSTENCGHKATWKVYMEMAAEMISKAKAVFITCQNTNGTCGWKEALKSYLNVADGMTNKEQTTDFLTGANCNNSTQVTLNSNIVLQIMGQQVMDQQVRDCSDLLKLGNRRSGVYTIYPLSRSTLNKNVSVYCDMETDGGGWTVIQRRGEYGNPIDFFYKDWKNYREGFGDLEKEFWLGNDNIHAITYQRYYSVRFDLADRMNNTRYAKYENFWITDEANKYALHITNYSGDAGDSMLVHNKMKFSASDQDNDIAWYHCSQHHKGAWWYTNCFDADLNGPKLTQHRPYFGMIWKAWKGYDETLDRSVIMIRPKNSKP